jgi:spermidine/putrescine transport system permease protein/putrescine transport system permease protein
MGQSPAVVTIMLKRIGLLIHAWWQFLFYFVPLILLIAISFWTLKHYQLIPAFTTENYRTIFSKGIYLNGLVTSLCLAATTALIATVLGLPISQAVNFHIPQRIRMLIIFVLFLPFLSSYIIRTFSWQLWLNDSGIIAFAFRKIGLLEGPLKLIYTASAIRIGLLSVLIPIASLIIFLSMSRIDKTLILAAKNLGASYLQIFWQIILPFTLPGIIIAFLFSFIISFGDFISPNILGGNQVYTLSVLIQDRVKINDWPMATALGTIMLIMSIAIITLIFAVLSALPMSRNSKLQGKKL